MSIANDYGVGILSAVTDALERAGGSVIDKESLNAGDTDFRTQLTKPKSKKIEVV